MTGVEAKELLEDLVGTFPGLMDGETEVNGSDLVEWLANALEGSGL